MGFVLVVFVYFDVGSVLDLVVFVYFDVGFVPDLVVFVYFVSLFYFVLDSDLVQLVYFDLFCSVAAMNFESNNAAVLVDFAVVSVAVQTSKHER